jgi:hypothetical protein
LVAVVLNGVRIIRRAFAGLIGVRIFGVGRAARREKDGGDNERD